MRIIIIFTLLAVFVVLPEANILDTLQRALELLDEEEIKINQERDHTEEEEVETREFNGIPLEVYPNIVENDLVETDGDNGESLVDERDVQIGGDGEVLVQDSYNCYTRYANMTINQTITGDFKQVILDAHNRLREDHGVAALVWDDECEETARLYVHWMTTNLNLTHSPEANRSYAGENIGFCAISRKNVIFAPIITTAAWYREESKHNYTINSAQTNGHFTQMVWNATTKLGCAMGTVNVGKWSYTYIGCHYQPTGNVNHQFLQNVFPKLNTDDTVENLETMVGAGDCDYFLKCHRIQSSCHISLINRLCPVICRNVTITA